MLQWRFRGSQIDAKKLDLKWCRQEALVVLKKKGASDQK